MKTQTDIPPVLRNKLIDDAYLRSAHETLNQVLAAQRETTSGLRKGSGLLGLFTSRSKKEAQIAAAVAEEKSTESAMVRLAAISQEINREIAGFAETFLTTNEPEYGRAKNVVREIVDWKNALADFEKGLAAFRRGLGQSRNMAAAGYDRKQGTVSAAAKALLAESLGAAKALEAGAKAVNAKSVAVGDLPLLKEEPYAEQVTNLMTRGVSEMQADFNKIITECEEMEKNGIPALHAKGDETANQKEAQARSILDTHLATLKTMATKKWIVPAETMTNIGRLEVEYPPRASGVLGAKH
jgi:hypothetical protein